MLKLTRMKVETTKLFTGLDPTDSTKEKFVFDNIIGNQKATLSALLELEDSTLYQVFPLIMTRSLWFLVTKYDDDVPPEFSTK